MSTLRSLIIFAVFAIAGCSNSEERIATATIQLESSKIEYFSLLPVTDHQANLRRPNCAWYFDKLFDVKAKSRYDSLSFSCSFYDAEFVEFQDEKLSLNMEFVRSNESEDFHLTKTLVRWSKGGLLYRSTLSKNKPFDNCEVLGCGMDVNKIQFPDVAKGKGDLVFDLTLDHNLSHNTTRNGALTSKFHFVGRAKHQRPLR